MKRIPLVAVAATACGGPPAPHGPLAEAAVTIELATEHGLSGLALGPDGALWTVAERAGAAYRVELDGERATLTRVEIAGLPGGVELEAIEALDDGGFLLGTETDGDHAAVLMGRRVGDRIGLAMDWNLSFDAGVPALVSSNHGVEGVCAAGEAIAIAFELVDERDGARFAQVIVTDRALSSVTRHQVRLTSATGKLAGLDCRAHRGGLDVLAIERHFETTRLVRFALPAPGVAEATVAARLTADLADLAAGRNFEGVARLPDGRVALVVDNQWRTIEGPSVLVLLPAAAAGAAAPAP